MKYAVIDLQSSLLAFITDDPDAAAIVALTLDVGDKQVAIYKMADARSPEFPMSFGDGTRAMKVRE